MTQSDTRPAVDTVLDAPVEAAVAAPAAADTLRLDDQLCFALYAAANAIVRSYRPLLREIGLTYPQYLVLMVLWEQDDQPVNRIAERLQLPANAITPMLARLEAAGFATRRADRSDGRVVRVGLTPAGAALEPSAAAVAGEVACRTHLDDDAVASLRTRLQSLVTQMSAPPTAAC